MAAVDHTITAPTTNNRQIGFKCSCGLKFATESLAQDHMTEVVNEAFNAAPEKENKLPEEPATAEKFKAEQAPTDQVDKKPIENDQPKAESKTAITKPKDAPPKDAPKAIGPVAAMAALVSSYGKTLVGDQRMKEFATRLSLMAKNEPKIVQAINENPESVLTTMMACVTYDLMPNDPEQHAFIIPYNSKNGMQVQFQLGYKGLLKLARRSGEVLTISAELVFSEDEFDVVYGTDRHIKHVPNFSIDRTKYSNITHAYATAKLSNGETPFAVMTKDEIEKVRKSAKASSTDAPWNTWPERQTIKTIYKRLAGVLPTSNKDMALAAQFDSASEAGKLRFVEGELVVDSGGVNELAVTAIGAANSAEEINAVLQGLPAAERKKAASLASDRLKELA